MEYIVIDDKRIAHSQSGFIPAGEQTKKMKHFNQSQPKEYLNSSQKESGFVNSAFYVAGDGSRKQRLEQRLKDLTSKGKVTSNKLQSLVFDSVDKSAAEAVQILS